MCVCVCVFKRAYVWVALIMTHMPCCPFPRVIRLSQCEEFKQRSEMICAPPEKEGFPSGTICVATEPALTSLVISLLWAESL